MKNFRKSWAVLWSNLKWQATPTNWNQRSPARCVFFFETLKHLTLLRLVSSVTQLSYSHRTLKVSTIHLLCLWSWLCLHATKSSRASTELWNSARKYSEKPSSACCKHRSYLRQIFLHRNHNHSADQSSCPYGENAASRNQSRRYNWSIRLHGHWQTRSEDRTHSQSVLQADSGFVMTRVCNLDSQRHPWENCKWPASGLKHLG